MLKKSQILGVTMLLVALYQPLLAQLSILPQVSQAGLIQKSQLWNVSISYGGSDNPSMNLEMTLIDRVSQIAVLSGTSAVIQLPLGVHGFNETSLGPIDYGSTGGQVVTGSGFLAAGIYEVCYRLVSADQKAELQADACQQLDVEPMSPPYLVSPVDSAVLDTQYPQYIWLAPTPLTIFSDLKHDLIVTEIYTGQTPAEAIERNGPLYSESDISGQSLVYPSSAVALDTGRYYAWQVVARNGQTYGAKTEAWCFKISTANPTPIIRSTAFYPRLSKRINEAVYIAESPVRFEFTNENNEAQAVVRLYRINNGKRVELDSKTIKLKAGQNFVTWDAALPNGQQQEKLLMLQVTLPSGQQWGCLLNQQSTTAQ